MDESRLEACVAAESRAELGCACAAADTAEANLLAAQVDQVSSLAIAAELVTTRTAEAADARAEHDAAILATTSRQSSLQAAIKKGLTAEARHALQAQRLARRRSAQAAVDDLQAKTAQVVEDLRHQQDVVGLETNLKRLKNSKAKPLIQVQKQLTLLSEQLSAAMRTLEAVLADNKAPITTDELEAYLRKLHSPGKLSAAEAAARAKMAAADKAAKRARESLAILQTGSSPKAESIAKAARSLAEAEAKLTALAAPEHIAQLAERIREQMAAQPGPVEPCTLECARDLDAPAVEAAEVAAAPAAKAAIKAAVEAASPSPVEAARREPAAEAVQAATSARRTQLSPTAAKAPWWGATPSSAALRVDGSERSAASSRRATSPDEAEAQREMAALREREVAAFERARALEEAPAREQQTRLETAHASAVTDAQIVADAAAAAAELGTWKQEFCAHTGKPYWWNTLTNVTAWELPDAPAVGQTAAAPALAPPACASSISSSSASAPQPCETPKQSAAVAAAASTPPPLPEPWRALTHADGKEYFWNTETNATSWERPLPPSPQLALWVCNACTFENDKPHALVCDVCLTPRCK